MKGKNYRTAKSQPYTRNEYIPGSPPSKIVKFVLGDNKGSYDYKLTLHALHYAQVRHNALEATRVSANKVLIDNIGETGYLLKVLPYPHIILRENKMIATAGADRLQEGMRKSFGKSIGRAARVHIGDPIIEIYVKEPHLEAAKLALKACASKLPTPTKVLIEKLEQAAA